MLRVLLGSDATNLVLPAASEERQARLFEQMLCAVPEDYRALLEETDGFEIGGWQFYGCGIRRVVLPEFIWSIAAGRSDTEMALCFREEEAQPVVYEYDEINDDFTPLDGSFMEALQSIAGRPE